MRTSMSTACPPLSPGIGGLPTAVVPISPKAGELESLRGLPDGVIVTRALHAGDKFLSRKNVLTDAMLDFLRASLFSPLVSQDAFDESAFEIEKKNILNDLEAEIENHFYHVH